MPSSQWDSLNNLFRAMLARGPRYSRRGQIQILIDILQIVEEHETMSKTKLANLANLNPLTLQRYVELLVNSGALVAQNNGGRSMLAATPRTALLRLLLMHLAAALSPEDSVMRNYIGLLEEVVHVLHRRGYRVVRGSMLGDPRDGVDNVFAVDLVAEGRKRLGVLLFASNDPLNLVRLKTLLFWCSSRDARDVERVVAVVQDERFSGVAGGLGDGCVATVGSVEEVGRLTVV